MPLALWLIAVLAGEPAGTPPGMVRVPAGALERGSDDSARADERPRHKVSVSSFFIDQTLVTRTAFAAFVADAGYRTTAEKRGYGQVGYEGLPDWVWSYTLKANWRQPFGPDGGYVPRDDDPVTMVSWLDAHAYCAWAKKRLPTEAEWEFAMRAGRSGTRFPWGDDPHLPDGGMGLNFWQGHDHRKAFDEDGYLYLSPVRAFPPNALGIYDPAGNLWQAVEDFYADDTYAKTAALDGGATDPRGPDGGTHHVARGGSWWCSPNACSAYGLEYRGKSVPHAAYNNNGFRCARSP